MSNPIFATLSTILIAQSLFFHPPIALGGGLLLWATDHPASRSGLRRTVLILIGIEGAFVVVGVVLAIVVRWRATRLSEDHNLRLPS